MTEHDVDNMDEGPDCWNCGGTGVLEGLCTCMECSCACLEPDPPICDVCKGEGVLA